MWKTFAPCSDLQVLPWQGLTQQNCSPGSGSRIWGGQLENEFIFVHLHWACGRWLLGQSGHRECFTHHKNCEGSLHISPTSSSAAQAEQLWLWDAHCSWAWQSMAQLTVFLSCCWQISEGGFPAHFTLDNACSTQLAVQEALKKSSLKFWCKRWFSFTSERGSGAAKAEHGAQPIPILNTPAFAVKLQLPPI